MARLQLIFSPYVLGRLTLLLVAAMAFACFWPFFPPRNTAAWTRDGHSVDFGRHGVLVGPGPLGPRDTDSGCTLDLWVEPDTDDTENVILAAYTPTNARLLRVEQYDDGLAVRSLARGDPTRTGSAQLYVDGVFAGGKPVLLTLTSDGQGTKAFVNGVFRRAAPGYRICHAMFTGRFVAGSAADSGSGWRGRMSGLAIFSRALSPGEVQRDFDTWPVRPGTTLGNRASLVALYPFDEGSGREVRDAVSRGNRFAMPDRYVVVAKSFLARPSPDNHLDIVANIIGFIPLGFTLCGYLSSRLGTGASLVTAIILCGLFSLSIESLQWFLPTRDSDMTDVITNTVGAVCGALLYRLRGAWLLGWISKWMR